MIFFMNRCFEIAFRTRFSILKIQFFVNNFIQKTSRMINYRRPKQLFERSVQTDLDQAENYAKKCQNALRAERLKLIRIQVADKIGAEALAEFDKAITEGNTEILKTSFSDAAFQANSANAASAVFSKNLKKHASVRLTNVKEEEAQTLPEDKPEKPSEFEAIPLEQLAAQPTRAQLYGEMFALIEESQETRKKLENIQDSEKNRQNQALQARLRSRRRRNVEKEER